jgi:hypothetical protein
MPILARHIGKVSILTFCLGCGSNIAFHVSNLLRPDIASKFLTLHT